MRKKFAVAAVTAALTTGFAAPILAQEQAAQDENAQMMDLYFDQNETVETATRAPKPLSEVAENVTIITAAEIERMNAHNVDEVLNRASGLFMSFNGQDFNGIAGFFVHDSNLEHVLILVDGIRWNEAYAGFPKTYNIPVEIISRIEIIKGPGSSTWGSSLGGVVNIITKKAGASQRPTGSISASYGKADSSEVNGTVAGKTGPASYFLAASSQDSDGLMGNRFFERDSIYAKVAFDLPKSSSLTLTSGYNEPKMCLSEYVDLGVRVEEQDRNFWFTANLDAPLSENLGLNVNAYRKKEKTIQPYYTLSDDNFLFEYTNDLWTNGFSALLNGRFVNHKVVLGTDYDRSESDFIGTVNHDETWGIFANDTVSFGDFSIIPGLRYDQFALTDDSMVSPSLGATWLFTPTTLFRAVVAKGFRRPYISDGASNPDLEPETITSSQLGVETTACPMARFKLSLFEHQVRDLWYYGPDTSWLTVNRGDGKRYGYELEAATEPWNNLSAQASFTWVYTQYDDNLKESDDQYTGKVTFLYDNPDLITAELFGIYTWWRNDPSRELDGDYDTMVWDLSASKRISTGPSTAVTLFATAHNLFDGRYYWHSWFENPHRWVEAGVKFHF
ncbi:MAG: TonB-dependent receptor [Pseudomonadota bacterium]